MSCLTGSGRAYGLELVKSPSTSTRTSQTSSPSSTITDSSNSPLAITTRKPRTPRKRPNQTYNEAAALLSTVYPNIFSIKHFSQPHKFLRPHEPKSSELFLPLRVSDNCGFLLHHPVPEKPKYRIESKLASFSCLQSGGEIDFGANSIGLCEECREDFDAESILDEEIEEGIDSIMGNLSTSSSSNNNDNNGGNPIPVGLGFGANSGFGFGVKRGIRAFRHVDNGNCWSFPTVDVHQISPRFNINNSNSNSKSGDKKKKKMESKNSEELAKEKSANSGLLLKLNYDKVLNAWSDRASPFSDETPSSDGNDVSARARLSEIDLLFSESGVREARAMRYKEKRRTRPFSRKIRYQVRKVNSDERPRMKGRFVRRPRSSKVVKYGK